MERENEAASIAYTNPKNWFMI